MTQTADEAVVEFPKSARAAGRPSANLRPSARLVDRPAERNEGTAGAAEKPRDGGSAPPSLARDEEIAQALGAAILGARHSLALELPIALATEFSLFAARAAEAQANWWRRSADRKSDPRTDA